MTFISIVGGFIILHAVLARGTALSGLHFRILTPRNNSVIGSAASFRVHLVQNTFDGFAPSAISFTVNVTLSFSNKLTGTDRSTFLDKSVYECYLSQSVFLPGPNVLTISLYAADNSTTPLHTEDLHLFSQSISQYDSRIDSLIEYTRSKELNDLTFMFIGSSTNSQVNWPAFVTLDARRIEYFHTSTAHDSISNQTAFDHSCKTLSGSGAITHCFDGLKSLHNVIYADTSFMCLQSLASLFDSEYRVSDVPYDQSERSREAERFKRGSSCESTESGE